MPSTPARNRRKNARAQLTAAAGITRDVLLGEEEKDPAPQFAPALPGTLYVYENALALWTEFHDNIGEQDTLSAGGLLPSFDRLKGWIRWIAYSAKGKQHNRVLRSTVMTYWSRLREVVHRRTSRRFLDELCEQVNAFIPGNIALSGQPELVLPIEKQDKPILDTVDLQTALKYLWCRDSYVYRDERYRVQLALLLQILVFSGCRPGAVTESNCHRGTNEVPLYKDFELSLVKDENDKVVMMLEMTIRYMKCGRNEERDSYRIPFHEDLKNFGLGFCPLTLFLALAFADNAFEGDLTPEGLLAMRDAQVCQVRSLSWKSSALDKPVFRQLAKNGMVSCTKGLSYDCLLRNYHDLLKRAGFLKHGSLYATRRGAANAIEDKLSAARLMQVMGHKDPKMFRKHYISKTTFADVQSLVQGENQRTGLIKKIQRMSNLRDERAPRELPLAEKAKVNENVELKGYREETAARKSKIKEEYGSLRGSPSAVRKDYESLKSKERDLGKRLEWESLYVLRKEWFTNMLTTPEGLREDTSSNANDFDEYIRIPDNVFTVERRRIATSFFGYPPTVDRLTILYDLMKLCSSRFRYGRESTGGKTDIDRNSTIKFYPGEEPVDGRCRFCGKDIDSIPPKSQVDHAHGCASYLLNTNIEREHAKTLQLQCRWGTCSARFNPLLYRASEIARHIQTHMGRGLICQWDWCGTSFKDRFELRKHLKHAHNVSDRAKAFKAIHCKLCMEWFGCEFVWEDHCRSHINTLDDRECCPKMTRPGWCLFCLGNTRMPYSRRFESFEKTSKLRHHMMEHLGKLSPIQTIKCPHPVCARKKPVDLFYNLEGIKEHSKKAHGMDIDTAPKKRKSSYDSIGPFKRPRVVPGNYFKRDK